MAETPDEREEALQLALWESTRLTKRRRSLRIAGDLLILVPIIAAVTFLTIGYQQRSQQVEEVTILAKATAAESAKAQVSGQLGALDERVASLASHVEALEIPDPIIGPVIPDELAALVAADRSNQRRLGELDVVTSSNARMASETRDALREESERLSRLASDQADLRSQLVSLTSLVQQLQRDLEGTRRDLSDYMSEVGGWQRTVSFKERQQGVRMPGTVLTIAAGRLAQRNTGLRGFSIKAGDREVFSTGRDIVVRLGQQYELNHDDCHYSFVVQRLAPSLDLWDTLALHVWRTCNDNPE